MNNYGHATQARLDELFPQPDEQAIAGNRRTNSAQALAEAFRRCPQRCHQELTSLLDATGTAEGSNRDH